MNAARQFHTATLLLSGQVLITGGTGTRPGQVALASAEIFDPDTNTFTSVGEMTTPRARHTATLLPDGRVLIVGGNSPWPGSETAELYDPKARTFTRTGDMLAPELSHTATLLNNGKVLIAGLKPQLFDPATGTFTVIGEYAPTPPNPYGPYGIVGATTLLSNGTVLIAGEPSTEIYDPVTGTFRLGGAMTAGRGPRGDAKPPWYLDGRTATLLTDARVLLTGGDFEDGGDFAEAELYNSGTGTFTPIKRMSRPRAYHTATLLRDGTVLIAGGFSHILWAIDSNEVYDPGSDTFWGTANLMFGRSYHTATLLMDGRVLLAGGYTGYPDNPHSASAELYVPSILRPAPVVQSIRLDRSVVGPGSSYSVNIAGSNLSPETFFDIRFITPGSNESFVVLNWQRGLASEHDVPAEILLGTWIINGVRAHDIETDHTGNFLPVSATMTVSP
jgi:Galactose oxidase, central domain